MKKNTAQPTYQPIENYGIIGDLNTVALVGINGSIDFMCFPDFDSPTIFAALLDIKKGGCFQIHPKLEKLKYKQLYLPDTNVLITRFLSSKGVGEITDFMPVEAITKGGTLIRQLIAQKGNLTYRMNCSPRFNYARSKHKIEQVSKYEILFTSKDKEGIALRLKSNIAMSIKGNDAVAEFTLKAGEKASFILLHEDNKLSNDTALEKYIAKNQEETINYWKDWIAQCNYDGLWREIVNRSALVLKLLTSSRYGSMVAAPTFSLPEVLGGERNWDYRYTWIRDTSFSVYALLNLGYTKEARDFIKWVDERCGDITGNNKLQLMYTIEGDPGDKEETLHHFEGYKKSKPVRIGNAAKNQIQLDIYGDLMDAVYLFDKYGESTSYRLWNNLAQQMNWLCDNWQRKDEGIWEVRGGKKHFLYSRMMCWSALQRAIRIGSEHAYPQNQRWIEERDKIFYSIHENFWNEELQSFVQYEGASTVDAATLLMPIINFIGPKDPKWLSTLKCIEERLVSDFLIYRYRPNPKLDGLDGGEGTFSMCTFWYVECLSMAGQLDKARLCFEKMLGYANHLGLYSEQLGDAGEFLGNFPQAFTHLGLIGAAISLNNQLADARNKRD